MSSPSSQGIQTNQRWAIHIIVQTFFAVVAGRWAYQFWSVNWDQGSTSGIGTLLMVFPALIAWASIVTAGAGVSSAFLAVFGASAKNLAFAEGIAVLAYAAAYFVVMAVAH